MTCKECNDEKCNDERLQAELEGLKNIVDRLWGDESPSMIKVIVRAKAMLENWVNRS